MQARLRRRQQDPSQRRRTAALLLIAGACLLIVNGCASVAPGQPDNDSTHAALRVLDRFMSAFSARDAGAHVATYHFPHFRLARGRMNQWNTQQDALQAHLALFKTLPDNGWHRSEWVHRNIITSSPTKVHVDTRFRRLRADGSEIGTYDSLYVLIKQDGRWGIKLRSSFL